MTNKLPKSLGTATYDRKSRRYQIFLGDKVIAYVAKEFFEGDPPEEVEFFIRW